MNIIEKGSIVNFRKGETIFKPDFLISDPSIFLITEGEIELIRHHTALKRDSFGFKKGEIFGMLEVFTGSSRITEAVALTDIQAIGFSKSEFEKNVMGDTAFAIMTIRLMSRLLRELNLKIKQID